MVIEPRKSVAIWLENFHLLKVTPSIRRSKIFFVGPAGNGISGISGIAPNYPDKELGTVVVLREVTVAFMPSMVVFKLWKPVSRLLMAV